MTVYIDGTAVGTTTTNGSGTWTYTPTTPLSNGPHCVDVAATDAAGNVSTPSSASGFTVDTVAPAPPVISTPITGTTTNDNTPTITGTAEPNSTVTVYVDGQPVGTTTTDGSGDWSLTPSTPLSDGSHTVDATATDQAGNTSPLPGANGSGSARRRLQRRLEQRLADGHGQRSRSTRRRRRRWWS